MFKDDIREKKNIKVVVNFKGKNETFVFLTVFFLFKLLLVYDLNSINGINVLIFQYTALGMERSFI